MARTASDLMEQHAVQFDSDLIRKYDQQGPRYTSYPTAVSFSSEFGAADYRAIARATNDLPIPAPLSLYVHIPFCEQLCYYCGCNKVVTRRREKCGPYIDAVLAEAALHTALFDPDREVRQLHLGGGTPTYLSDDDMRRLMVGLAERFSFAVGDEREFSIEIDPRTVTPERLAHLKRLGFNRISMGIQDFDSRVQLAVNREQSVDQVASLFDSARDLDIKSVSVDLIYGLPHQTVRSFHRTLQIVTQLRPDRISVYNYAHLPDRFRAQRLIRAQDLPSADHKLALLNLTVDFLTGAGYEYIGMDHFALPEDELCRARDNGTLQRNFQGYSTCGGYDLIGLGVSAISHVGPSFAQNEIRVDAYAETVGRGELPLVRGLATSKDDRQRAEIISHLMCYGEIPIREFESRWSVEFGQRFRDIGPRLEALAADGLLVRSTTGYTVTPRGWMLLRPIAMCFDAYIDAGKIKGFSKLI